MATYTVIQDIEAEDKLLGPLSLRQFIYAVIVVVLGFLVFQFFLINPLLAFPLLPPMILFGVLAAPFGHDQSSEIWLLAKIRFFLKPRLRIWNQSGLQELVKITVPKRLEEHLTNGLDETQVKSRLQALAQTIDTRGWAVKGVDVNLYANPSCANPVSDRLVSPNMTLAAVPNLDIKSDDDILDTQDSSVAQKMKQMVQANDQAHRQALLDKMDQIRGQHRTPTPQPANINNLPPLMPHPSAYGHTTVLKPTNIAPTTPVTQPPKPAILGLASNDDLSVATIARQANKSGGLDDDEVVISLR